MQLYVTKRLAKQRKMVENLVTQSIALSSSAIFSISGPRGGRRATDSIAGLPPQICWDKVLPLPSRRVQAPLPRNISSETCQLIITCSNQSAGCVTEVFSRSNQPTVQLSRSFCGRLRPRIRTLKKCHRIQLRLYSIYRSIYIP